MIHRENTITDIANRLNQEHEQGQKLPSVIFITDQQAIPNPENVISGLAAGAAVIFRDYDHPLRAELGQKLAALCREKDIFFLVAGDIALAENLAAEDLVVQNLECQNLGTQNLGAKNLSRTGMHLPENMMMKADEIRRAHPLWMITVACHDLNSVRKASKLPIDAGLISPVFPTHSHALTLTGAQKTHGLRGVQNMVHESRLPLYGLGGISSENGHELIGSGLVGLAAIRGFQGVPHQE